MNFDFRAHKEDIPINGLSSNIIVLIIGLIGMFILPTIVAVGVLLFLPSDQLESNIDFWSYIAQLLAYGIYVIFLFLFIGKERIKRILEGFISGRNIKTAIIFALSIVSLISLTVFPGAE